MQMVGMNIGRGRNPFIAGKSLSEDEKCEWSMLVEHSNKERLDDITFNDLKDRGLLEDTPENRDKFNQLFAARQLGKSIFQR